MIRNLKGQVCSYYINSNFFSKPNLLNSYWAGFIAADGNLEKNTNKLIIDLANKDVRHLYKLKKYLNFNGKIRYYKYSDRSYVRLGFKNLKICSDLKKNFNITSRKSLTLKPPKGLTKKQALAYIAGYIDGDGSFNINTMYKKNKKHIYLRLSILGTKNVLSFIEKILSAKGKIYRQNERIFQLVYWGDAKVTLVKKQILNLDLPLLGRKWFLKK